MGDYCQIEFQFGIIVIIVGLTIQFGIIVEKNCLVVIRFLVLSFSYAVSCGL